ncbi:MAG: 5-formyltetrahydrofolate cyclo-ligase, partial [Candidatus Diapherotrites archaeon]|nr:5-formyltetrahydrofolate cyclo-ligase [Candidatus Diapherotrites archaeon]
FLKLEQVQGAKTLLLYVGVKSEAQTLNLIEQLLKMGKTVAVPVTDFEKHDIKPVQITSTSSLKEGKAGLLEPKAIRAVETKAIDLIVVPGIAFDREGRRIGSGFGFYDKLLRKVSCKVPLVGFCFQENLVEMLPAESHDIKMDMVITDKELIRTG